MDNYAYEKRALIQGEVCRNKKSIKKMGIFICSGVLLLMLSISLVSKNSSVTQANQKNPSELTFDNYNNYTYSKASIESDFGRLNFVKGDERLFIKEDALCIKYPLKSEGIDKSGASINSVLEGRDEYNLEYEICFDGNGNEFDWQEGGMLSGLAGGKFYNGVESKISDYGFHAMLIYNNYGYLYPCVYAVNDAYVGGKIYQKVGRAYDGRWLKIRMNVKLNDASKANGTFKIWLDDKLCYKSSGIRYRTNTSKIDISNTCAFSNNTKSKEGAKQEQFVYIDNIKIY